MFLVVREYQDGPVQYWRLESASPVCLYYRYPRSVTTLLSSAPVSPKISNSKHSLSLSQVKCDQIRP